MIVRQKYFEHCVYFTWFTEFSAKIRRWLWQRIQGKKIVGIHAVLQNTSAIEVRPSPARFQKDSSIVVITTFLTVDAGLLIFDCCVHLPPEEDHRLPPTLGKVPSWPSLPSFVDCRCRRRTTSPLPHYSFASASSWSHSLFARFPPSHRKESHTKIEGINF